MYLLHGRGLYLVWVGGDGLVGRDTSQDDIRAPSLPTDSDEQWEWNDVFNFTQRADVSNWEQQQQRQQQLLQRLRPRA